MLAQLNTLNIPYELITLDGQTLRNDITLMAKLYELAEPSYQDPTAVIQRESNCCTHLYLLLRNNSISAFYLCAYELVRHQAKLIPMIYMGLCVSNQADKNSGLFYHLLNKMQQDGLAWQKEQEHDVLLWYTTATPSAYHAASQIFSDHMPRIDGSYSVETEEYAIAIRKHMGWSIPQGHPLVLPGVAVGTCYSEQELNRIAAICQRKNFSLFNNLGIDETKGDRLLGICRLPNA
jgi:hypothetical protein